MRQNCSKMREKYERKKNINLALKSFAKYLEKDSSKNVYLVIAGGYDSRLMENVEQKMFQEGKITCIVVCTVLALSLSLSVSVKL